VHIRKERKGALVLFSHHSDGEGSHVDSSQLRSISSRHSCGLFAAQLISSRREKKGKHSVPYFGSNCKSMFLMERAC